MRTIVAGYETKHQGFTPPDPTLLLQDLWMVDNAVGFDSGAALADTYSTALLGLHRLAKIHEGSTVLVTAAAGGLGLAAVDLASSVYKAKVCINLVAFSCQYLFISPPITQCSRDPRYKN